jgi:hypothetical protein
MARQIHPSIRTEVIAKQPAAADVLATVVEERLGIDL